MPRRKKIVEDIDDLIGLNTTDPTRPTIAKPVHHTCPSRPGGVVVHPAGYGYVPEKGVPWYEWPVFPTQSCSSPWAIKPNEMKEMLDEYGETSTPIVKIMKDRGFYSTIFFGVLNRFPEVKMYYLEKQKNKAHCYNNDAVAVYQEDIPKDFWQTDKLGNRVPVMAGIRYMENKSNMWLRQAEIHEMGTYQQRIAHDNRNMNFNVNVNANVDINDLEKMPLEALLRPND